VRLHTVVAGTIVACALGVVQAAGTGDIGPVDAFIDMSAGTPGTALTPAIMAAGTKGCTGCSWMTHGGAGGMTVGPHRINRLSSVTVGGITYPANHPSQSIAYDNAFTFTAVEVLFPSNTRTKVTAAGFITLGAPNAGFNGSLSDLVSIYLTSGAYTILQLNNGNTCCGAPPGNVYGINVETDGSGTLHSPYIVVTPGATYWYSMQADYGAGRGYLNLYTTAGTLVGSVSVQSKTGSNLRGIRYGNLEVAKSPGTFNYFENSLIDYTNAVFPLGPGVAATRPAAPPNLRIVPHH
jgi:hypothetical protein